jgi:hypothetical protein
MPKSVKILRLLPANTGSGNRKTKSPGSIAAVPVFGKQCQLDDDGDDISGILNAFITLAYRRQDP